jgi:hypothetical protein
MTSVDEIKEKGKDLTTAGSDKGSLAKKVLVPLAASAASAATAYAVRKVPRLIQEELLPKLKKSDRARDALDKAKATFEQAISGVKEHASSSAATQPSNDAVPTRTKSSLSSAEREQKQRERAERRSERREALSS